jgi:hypothetical protein
MEAYPADHFALILDDHGNGLSGGLSDHSSGSRMSLAEMKLALATIEEQAQKVDVLYMAMCLMGMLEDAYQFRGLADYYVANQDKQKAYADPYKDYVAGLASSFTPAQVAQWFGAVYAENASTRSAYHALSVVDLAQVDAVAQAAHRLGSELLFDMEIISPTLSAVLTDVQRFDNESPSGLSLADSAIDLYHFADLVSVRMITNIHILNAAVDLMAAVDAAVLHEWHGSDAAKNLDNNHGLSVFFPATASSFYDASNYDFAVGGPWDGLAGRQVEGAPAGAGTWAGMLGAYFAATQPGGPDDPEPPDPAAKELPGYSLYVPFVDR